MAVVLAMFVTATALAAGVLDTGFGGDGRVVTGFAGGAYANAVAALPGGGVVVAGAAAGPDRTGVFALARYTATGELVDRFGGDGRVVTPVSSGGDEANAVAVMEDGRIVVAGTAGREAIAVARYLPDGTLDASFGGDGIVTTDVTSDRTDLGNAVAVLPNGRVLVAGTTGTSRPKWVVARYRESGARDPTFGDHGVVITPMGVWGVAYAIAIQPDGRIVVVGTDSGMALARYRRDGSLDPSFGHGGVVRDTWQLAWGRAVALQPDGRIVVAGDRDIFRVAVARFTRRGRPDPTFGGGDGRVAFDVGASEQGAVGIGILPGGRIVGGARVGPHESTEPQPFRFVAFRLRAGGTLDPAFDGDGVAVTRVGDGALASGATLGPRGRLTVVGAAAFPDNDGFAVVRYVVG